eukprot:g1153.t1
MAQYPAHAELKVVVLGDKGVGKTCLVQRYIEGTFSTHTSATIGAFFLTKLTKVGNTNVKLQIWDTAGQERFRAMAPMYYRGAAAALIVFDVTNETSFMCMKDWVDELQTNVPEGMVIGIACNKADLDEDRVVSFARAEGFAKSIGASIRDTSAKSSEGVEDIFDEIARRAVDVLAAQMSAGSTDSLAPGSIRDLTAGGGGSGGGGGGSGGSGGCAC